MIRYGEVAGWSWWWLDDRTVLIRTRRHNLLLADPDTAPTILGPGYVDREISLRGDEEEASP